MRQATATLTPDRTPLHPADVAVARLPTVERRSIESFTAIEDGSWVLLYSVRGDLEAGERLLAARDDVRAVATAPTGDGAGLAFVHVEASPTLDELRLIERTTPVVVRLPVGCLPDGGIRLTILGPDAAIQEAVERVPDGVAVAIESIGGFEGTLESLPPGQRAVLEAAVARGYYETPRRCTQRELAAALDIAPSTLNEHLQKLEARIVSAVVDRP